MWIEEKTTKNGGKTFVYYERYNDPQTGKTRRVSVSLASNTRAAVKQATAMLQSKIADRLGAVSLDERRLDDVIREWLDFRAVAVKPSTLYGLKNQLAALSRELPADILISRVDLPAVQGVITGMQARKMSRAYVVKILGTLRQLFKYAAKMRYIDRADWLDDVEVQRQEKTRADVERDRARYLDAPTLARVLEELAAIHPRIALLCEFQALTGLRIGEVAALRTDDYDEKAGEIDVNATYDFQNRVRTTPKTAASFRRVAIGDRARRILGQLIAENYARAHWFAGYEDAGYIFTTSRGNPIDRHEVSRALRRLSIDRRITSHDFRHTHISMLLEAGVPVRAVMERVGHATMQTTLEIYAHVSKAARSDAVVKLDDFLKRAQV